MRQAIKYEFWVGLFLLLGIVASIFMGLKVADVQGFSEIKSYKIFATFDNIGGLKVRSPLRAGGVVIGRVVDITLDENNYLPQVTIAIDDKYNQIPDNSSLSIKTSGLLGEQYVALSIGFDDGETPMWENGSKVSDTKSAIVLEDLIGQFLYGDNDTKKGNPEESLTVQ